MTQDDFVTVGGLDITGNPVARMLSPRGRDISADPRFMQVTVVTDTVPYTAGDCVGGKITFSNILDEPLGKGYLENIFIIDTGNVAAALKIFFFNTDQSSTMTNNAAFTLSSSDYSRIIGFTTIATGDYVTLGGVSIVSKTLNRAVFQGVGTKDIIAGIVTPDTPTYAASALRLSLGITQV